MKNIFEVNSEEKNRIRGLHENRLFSHGTSLMVLNEQSVEDLENAIKKLEGKVTDNTASEEEIKKLSDLKKIVLNQKTEKVKQEKVNVVVPIEGEDKETFMVRCQGGPHGPNDCEEKWLKANPKQVPGCTDALATNYNPLANVDDNSCETEEEDNDTNTGKYQDLKLIAKWNKEARDVYNNSLYKIGASGLNVFSDESAREDLKKMRGVLNPLKYIKGDGFITQLKMLSTKPYPIKDKNSGSYKGIKIPVSDVRSEKKPKNRRQRKNYKRYCQPKYIKVYFGGNLNKEAAIYFDCESMSKNKLFIDPKSFMAPLKKLGDIYTKIEKEREKLPAIGN